MNRLVLPVIAVLLVLAVALYGLFALLERRVVTWR